MIHLNKGLGCQQNADFMLHILTEIHNKGHTQKLIDIQTKEFSTMNLINKIKERLISNPENCNGKDNNILNEY